MKKKIEYTDNFDDADLDNARVVKDFLPRPKDLVLRKERPITLRLNEITISELKAEAARKGMGVSTLIRMWVHERLEQTHEVR
jgi:predicted DNA binding CopG/RHH family protein